MLGLNLNFAIGQSNDHLYDYYDDYDGSTTADPTATDFPITNPPTTTTTTTTTTTRPFIGRRLTRPSSGVVYYNRRVNTYNKDPVTESVLVQDYQQPRVRITSTSSTQSPAGINRNVVDLERSENRKNYAQSRAAEDTESEDDRAFSRRYARFLFNQRTGWAEVIHRKIYHTPSTSLIIIFFYFSFVFFLLLFYYV